MKTMKRLFATVLAVMMAFCLSVPAFAQTEIVGSGSGSITIDNANVDQTYKIYKVFDATYSGEGTSKNVSYTYTKSGEDDTLFTALTATGSPFVLTESTTSGVYVVTVKDGKSDADVVSYVESISDKLTLVATATVGENETSLTFTGLDYGYYYITTTTGTLVTINSAAPNQNVKDKNNAPSVDKEVKEGSDYGESNTAGIGDTVEYKVTITAKAGAENYVLHDTMSEGLTFNNDVAVKVGETYLTEGTDYTVNNEPTDGFTFEVVFKQSYLDTIKEDTTIVITYSATVNEDAVIDSTGNTNEAKLKYGENNDLTGGEKTTTTYVYDFDVFKYTGDNTALAGAKFVLYKDVNGTKYYAQVADGKLTGWTTNVDEATTLESDTNGSISVDGLDAGTYYLLETEAPDGYNKLTEAQAFTIGEDGSITANGATASNGVINIENKAGKELPTTGGMGTTMFYVVGGILIAGAAVLLITKKRMEK